MSGPLQVERDVEVGRWIQAALAEDGTVAAVVPDVFEAYARVLHPASLSLPPDGSRRGPQHPELPFRPKPVDVTWAETAELLGLELAEGTWYGAVGEHQVALGDGRYLNPPEEGDTPLEVLTAILETVLAEEGDAELLAAVWEGRGLDFEGTGFAVMVAGDETMTSAERARLQEELTRRARLEAAASVDPQVRMAMRDGLVLGLPREGWGRGHVLLRGRLRDLEDPAWVETAGLGWPAPDARHPIGPGRTPNLLWPAEPDRRPAWMVATDLDVDSTIVAGSARLVGRILGDDRLEAVRALPSTRIA